LASVLISNRVFLTLLASSITVLRHVFLGLPTAPFTLGVPLQGLPGYIVGRFSQCMAQPPPHAFPDLQIYSRLLRALPQLFILYLAQPENSPYFPQAFINADL